MIPEGNPFHCRASFLSIISNHAFAPCSLSIFRFFTEETLAARAPLALEADLFGLQAKPFIFEKHDIPTVAILAQGTSWAVAATQAFSLVWNNILSRMTLISYLLLKSNSTGPLNAFRIMLDTFRGMINTFRSIMNTFRNRLKHTPPWNAFSECN